MFTNEQDIVKVVNNQKREALTNQDGNNQFKYPQVNMLFGCLLTEEEL